jgi:hypothetical protein
MAADDPISPELILVSSPEEAERARALLPAPSPPPKRPQEPPRAHARPRRTRTWVLVAAGVLVLAVAGIVVWSSLTGTSKPPPAAAPPRVTTSTALPAVTPTVTAPAHVTTARPRAVTTTPTPAPPRRTTTTTTKAAPAKAAFVPARVWLWQRVPGVTHYLFELTLNGKRVVVAHTRTARYALPRSFRFRAGTYRWTVRRLPLTKSPPLTDSRFVVTAQSAALANR